MTRSWGQLLVGGPLRLKKKRIFNTKGWVTLHWVWGVLACQCGQSRYLDCSYLNCPQAMRITVYFDIECTHIFWSPFSMGHLLEIVDGVLRSVRIIRPKSYCHPSKGSKGRSLQNNPLSVYITLSSVQFPVCYLKCTVSCIKCTFGSVHTVQSGKDYDLHCTVRRIECAANIGASCCSFTCVCRF